VLAGLNYIYVCVEGVLRITARWRLINW